MQNETGQQTPTPEQPADNCAPQAQGIAAEAKAKGQAVNTIRQPSRLELLQYKRRELQYALDELNAAIEILEKEPGIEGLIDAQRKAHCVESALNLGPVL